MSATSPPKEKILKATQKSSLVQTHPLMIIDLKRFDYDMMKVSSSVSFPLEIDLSAYVDKSVKDRACYQYELYGVIIHR